MGEVQEEMQIGDNKLLRIFLDECPESPREMDNLSKIVAVGKWSGLTDSDIADHHCIPGNLYELEAYIRETWNVKYLEELKVHEHSAVTIGVGVPECRWDTMNVGYVFVTEEDAEPISEGMISDIVHNELETYSLYVNGEVYGFKMFELKKCECCEHVKETEIDACWGFYGANFKRNGLFETAGVCPRCQAAESLKDRLLCRSCQAEYYGELVRESDHL